MINYWLASPPAGPGKIEIRDSAGDLVQSFTSEPSPALAAETYFASSWIHPTAPLSRAAGLQSVVWNLRYHRPSAIRYAYSIATVPGPDTPVSPEGALAPPGRYEVTLDV